MDDIICVFINLTPLLSHLCGFFVQGVRDMMTSEGVLTIRLAFQTDRHTDHVNSFSLDYMFNWMKSETGLLLVSNQGRHPWKVDNADVEWQKESEYISRDRSSLLFVQMAMAKPEKLVFIYIWQNALSPMSTSSIGLVSFSVYLSPNMVGTPWCALFQSTYATMWGPQNLTQVTWPGQYSHRTISSLALDFRNEHLEIEKRKYAKLIYDRNLSN